MASLLVRHLMRAGLAPNDGAVEYTSLCSPASGKALWAEYLKHFTIPCNPKERSRIATRLVYPSNSV